MIETSKTTYSLTKQNIEEAIIKHCTINIQEDGICPFPL